MSNVSFGLPGRELINQSFLTLALANGLDLPIINPNVEYMTGAVRAFRVLYNYDVGAVEFIGLYSKSAPACSDSQAVSAVSDSAKNSQGLSYAVGAQE